MKMRESERTTEEDDVYFYADVDGGNMTARGEKNSVLGLWWATHMRIHIFSTTKKTQVKTLNDTITLDHRDTQRACHQGSKSLRNSLRRERDKAHIEAYGNKGDTMPRGRKKAEAKAKDGAIKEGI